MNKPASREPGNAQRRCALALHSLTQADRDWMLARLPAEAGDEMRALLDELRQLGLPPDPELVRSAITDTAKSDPAPAGDVSADQVGAFLCDEPPLLIAAALAGRSSTERERAFEALPFSRRQAVRDELRRVGAQPGPIAPALVKAIERELASTAGRNGAGRSPLARMRTGFSRVAGVFL